MQHRFFPPTWTTLPWADPFFPLPPLPLPWPRPSRWPISWAKLQNIKIKNFSFFFSQNWKSTSHLKCPWAHLARTVASVWLMGAPVDGDADDDDGDNHCGDNYDYECIWLSGKSCTTWAASQISVNLPWGCEDVQGNDVTRMKSWKRCYQ